MSTLVAERNAEVAARVRRTGLGLAAFAACLFAASVGFVLLGWWMR